MRVRINLDLIAATIANRRAEPPGAATRFRLPLSGFRNGRYAANLATTATTAAMPQPTALRRVIGRQPWISAVTTRAAEPS